jgi:hypothetical protein
LFVYCINVEFDGVRRKRRLEIKKESVKRERNYKGAKSEKAEKRIKD